MARRRLIGQIPRARRARAIGRGVPRPMATPIGATGARAAGLGAVRAAQQLRRPTREPEIGQLPLRRRESLRRRPLGIGRVPVRARVTPKDVIREIPGTIRRFGKSLGRRLSGKSTAEALRKIRERERQRRSPKRPTPLKPPKRRT